MSVVRTPQPPHRVRTILRTVRFQLIVVSMVALFQGLLYLFLLPPWQHYDEPTHFEYAWLVAARGRRPALDEVDTTMRREVAASMVEHDFYWNLPKPDLLADGQNVWIGVSELPHQPTYYLLASLPLRLGRHLDITSQLYLARFVSLLLFVLTILVSVGIVSDLTADGHPLRWLVPLTVVLIPPFVDLMTGVNNDAGATFAFTLFLWGAVRTIRFGVTGPRLFWIVAAALLGVLTKTTASVVVATAPLALLIAFSARHLRHRRPVGVGAAGLLIVAIALLFEGGDAAYWFRWDKGAVQEIAVQAAAPAAPFGSHIGVVEAVAADPGRGLFNQVLQQDLAHLAGQPVTVGGWIWSDWPGTVPAPGLVWSQKGTTRLDRIVTSVEVTTTPTFVAHTFTVPEESGKLYYALFAGAPELGGRPRRVYLDGAFLIPGSFPDGTRPDFDDGNASTGRWAGRRVTNLVHNASFEQGWPRLHPWVEQSVTRYTRRSAAQVFGALFDIRQVSDFLTGVAAPALLYSFFGWFAWGHVQLSRPAWPYLFLILVLVATAGCLKWYSRGKAPRFVRPALAFLALTVLVVWGNALLSPLAYFTWAKSPLPNARYTFPAIIPTVMALAGGWWFLPPRSYRRYAALALLIVLIALNALSVWTIHSFYEALPR